MIGVPKSSNPVINPDDFAHDVNSYVLITDCITPHRQLIKFRPESEITEEMRDPDYALKQLAKLNNGKYIITCSKCHHCR